MIDVNILQATEEFMRAAGQLDNPPSFVDRDLRNLRWDLLNEEINEYFDAELADDAVEVADGLADVIVIAYGSLLAYFGKEKADRILAEVARSNLDKIGPDGTVLRREDGKILKPEGFRPPDIAGVLNG